MNSRLRARSWTCSRAAAFVSDYLDRAVTGLSGHAGWSGAVRMEATDTGRVHEVGDMTSASPVIVGPEYALLAWLLGRSDGGELSREEWPGCQKSPSSTRHSPP